MKKLLLMLAMGGAASAAHALPNATEVIPAQGGSIKITPIFHGSLQIEYKGKVIQVDPFSAGDYTGAKKADYILITHSHPDHLDYQAIAAVQKKGTDLVVPSSVASFSGFAKRTSSLRKVVIDRSSYFDAEYDKATELRKDGKSFPAGFEVLNVMSVEVVPAYNVERGPKPGQKSHPKSQHFNGYVLTVGGKRIYIAGDTEATPEMKALKNIDIAFLPMNLPFTMTPQEAAAGAKAFKPKVVYPYHYRYPFNKANDNPQQFAKSLEGTGIQVRLRNWYGHPAK